MNTRLIGKYSQSHLAYIHKGVLEESGLDVFIFGNNFMSVAPNLTGILDAGIELRVREEDFEKAREILQFQEDDKMICANCGSGNIKFSYGKNGLLEIVFSVFSALVVSTPFGNIKRQYFCKDCGFKNQD
ncbi:DUF2007 domain-containing protein [Moheibacter sp.]|uniref:putative signal transducing protein n=1 Tax=Moheibacter sp. TaxID=1965316 RepID=UPI003C77AC4B